MNVTVTMVVKLRAEQTGGAGKPEEPTVADIVIGTLSIIYIIVLITCHKCILYNRAEFSIL